MNGLLRRERFRFIGRVQGVGFRMTVRGLADGRPIAGWVQNEPDGSVTCVAEGLEHELEAFLTEIRKAMAGHITSLDRVEEPVAPGDLEGFSIKFGPDLGR